MHTKVAFCRNSKGKFLKKTVTGKLDRFMKCRKRPIGDSVDVTNMASTNVTCVSDRDNKVNQEDKASEASHHETCCRPKRSRLFTDQSSVPESRQSTDAIVTPSGSNTKINWSDGRRIVELGLLASSLKKGCCSCHQNLCLWNTYHELRNGLCSTLYIRCSDCNQINRVLTGKTHYHSEKVKTKPVHDINSKLVTGKFKF